jgi:hypothetical protein
MVKGKFTTSGYPKDSDSLRDQFDKMLEDATVQRNIVEAESLFEGFTSFMERSFVQKKRNEGTVHETEKDLTLGSHKASPI